jgi:hypothetical protein
MSLVGGIGAIRQLEGLGEMFRGLGTVVLACAEDVAALAEARPEPEIGKRQDRDYERYHDPDADEFVYENRFVRTSNGRPVACNETRVLEWQAVREDRSRPCSELSGAEIQAFINDQLALARAAATALCTDPDCDKPRTPIPLTWQKWECMGRHEMRIWLQLELTCSREV